MKKIFQIYKRDFKRLSKNVVALVVAVGICILPALYAWFNIAANWDPYGSTDGIEVAVVNLDQTYKVESLDFNIGEQIIENLKSNKQIGWTFVDDEDALDGVKSGKYYAAIVIPKDFSEKMSSILTGKLEAPQLDYYVNEKKNAIAPKITDKGATAIQQQVNSTFISTATETIANVLNVTASELDSSGVTLVDKLLVNLRTVSTDLGQYERTIDAFVNVADGVDQLTKAAQLTIPDAKKVVKNSDKVLNDSAKTLKSSRKAASTMTSSVSDVMSTSASTFDTVASLTNTALLDLEGDANNAANAMDNATGTCDAAIKVNNTLLDLMKNLLKLMDEDRNKDAIAAIQGVIVNLENANKQQETLKSQVKQAAKDIRTSTTTADTVRKSISTTVSDGKADLKKAKSSYENKIQPQLGTLMDDISSTSSSISGLLSATDGSLGNLNEIFENTNGALASGKEALNNTKSIIGTTRDKLGEIISQVEAVSKDEQLNKLIDVLQNDPDLTGNFMSSPVQLKTTSLYEIENYGSAMAPFYSVLAIWVGAIVLVAIMKVGVDDDDEIPNHKPTQAYLGRYLTFMTFGFVQATVIALGDLFYLRIQCHHPVKFFICAWVCSFVFTNIVYALTVSFGAIGKAISVIFLVLQIGGSGGTFPIEVTPPFFQAMNPIMPFTYGINAMRECVAGVYKNAYWVDLSKLLIYVPIALLLGLVLRRPLMNLTKFFEQRLEDSKLL